ncbi:cobalt-precorrin 5A hydrolase [Clostridium weizhouense]|uniref:Cobalt-precorrin 5A hydrolase n=1 Tax=Clostridium weizhouense TaxID=2859781 RepID=A0ABS7AKQ3_9CLOT|nr:cobalt-precorrin 5A hydrolase [Clostridium weizhouense]MBW6409229.1 cobalt-precorrin 5A hydrolase [Clostridium weizhouense]
MISIICPSPKGKEMAYFLKKSFNGILYIKEEGNNCECELDSSKEINSFNNLYSTYDFNLSNVTKEAFNNSNGIIFISSTGIAVRAIAPFIKTKDKDPGVVVVDLANKYSISLLSGHLGGGNELATKISKLLNNTPIITTATDNLGIVAPDVLAKHNDFIIEDLKKAKYISSLLVKGNLVGIKDDYKKLDKLKGYELIPMLREDSIWITHKIKADKDKIYETKELNLNNGLDYSKILRLIKKDLILGIGCRRDTPSEKLEECIRKYLTMNNLDIKAVKEIVSIDIKKNEKAIIDLSKTLECEFKTFSVDEIKKVEDKFEKSDFVLKNVGVYNVCEPCVDLSGGKIIVNKIKDNGITLCIGVKE